MYVDYCPVQKFMVSLVPEPVDAAYVQNWSLQRVSFGNTEN